jgi:hypothetical protein
MLVADRAFLANHARVLLCLAPNPGVRLPGIAASLGITERSAHGIVTDLAEAGRIVKQEDGRRNRYQIPGTPAAARTHPAGTHLRRSPGPPGRNRRRPAEPASPAAEGTRWRGQRVLPGRLAEIMKPQVKNHAMSFEAVHGAAAVRGTLAARCRRSRCDRARAPVKARTPGAVSPDGNRMPALGRRSRPRSGREWHSQAITPWASPGRGRAVEAWREHR